MKKISMLLLCTAALITAILLLRFPIEQHRTPSASSSEANVSYYFSSNTPSSQETSSTVKTDVKTKNYYTIRAYDGCIGVFRNDETKPFREYDAEIDVLPDQDRERLESGIVVYTIEDVEKTIEDYDG